MNYENLLRGKIIASIAMIGALIIGIALAISTGNGSIENFQEAQKLIKKNLGTPTQVKYNGDICQSWHTKIKGKDAELYLCPSDKTLNIKIDLK